MTAYLPTGWEPRRIGTNLEFPPKPISSPIDLVNWLNFWLARLGRWRAALRKQPELVLAAATPVNRKPHTVRVSADTCDFVDLCREMRNARRALGEWNITGAPRWDGDPPRDWTDEERLNAAAANIVEMRDWLRFRVAHS